MMNTIRQFALGVAVVVVGLIATTSQAESPAFVEAMQVQSGSDYAEGCRMLLACADGGDADCQGEASRCLWRGDGVPRDITGARRLAEASAKQGSRSGIRQLALFHYYGVGGPIDFASALTLGMKAAELGDTRARGLVGTLYRFGEGVSKNEAEAFKWLQKGAELGDPYSQREFGDLYATGMGVTKDAKAAMDRNVAVVGMVATDRGERRLISWERPSGKDSSLGKLEGYSER